MTGGAEKPHNDEWPMPKSLTAPKREAVDPQGCVATLAIFAMMGHRLSVYCDREAMTCLED